MSSIPSLSCGLNTVVINHRTATSPTVSASARRCMCVFGSVVRIRYACVGDNCCWDQTSKQEIFSRYHVVCGIRVLCPRSAAPRRRRWNVSVVVSAVCSIGGAKFSMRVYTIIGFAGERTNKPESHVVLWFVFISLFALRADRIDVRSSRVIYDTYIGSYRVFVCVLSIGEPSSSPLTYCVRPSTDDTASSEYNHTTATTVGPRECRRGESIDTPPSSVRELVLGPIDPSLPAARPTIARNM